MELVEYQVMAAVEQRHWWYAGMRAISAALLDPYYPHGASGLRVLDAGCGSAGNARFLARYGEVQGCDVSPLALRYGARNLPGRLLCGSVLQLPYADESFDLVTSFDVLYHACVPSEAAALRETLRVLRPGGRLLIRLPAFEILKSKHDLAVHTRRRYRLGDVRVLLESAGLVVERATYVNSLLFLPRLLQRLATRAVTTQERQRSDLELSDGPLNEVLLLLLTLEARWLMVGGRFPAGTSALCLARKAPAAPVPLELRSPVALAARTVA